MVLFVGDPCNKKNQNHVAGSQTENSKNSPVELLMKQTLTKLVGAQAFLGANISNHNVLGQQNAYRPPKNTKDCHLTFQAHHAHPVPFEKIPFEKKSPVRTSSPAAPRTSFPGMSYKRHLGREFRGRLLRLGAELRGLLKPRGWRVGSFRKSKVKEELGIETFISCRSFTSPSPPLVISCHICWFFYAFHDFDFLN